MPKDTSTGPPPIIELQNTARTRDYRIRCVIAIIIGFIGFWGPLWYESTLDFKGDSRIGMILIPILPLILAAAIWATLAFQLEPRPRYLAALLLLFVWSPILYVGFNLGVGILRTIL